MRRSSTIIATAAFVTVFAACGADRSTSPGITALDGPWSTHQFDVALVLDLDWSADSVHGTGSYTVLSNTIGCGGATLTGSGQVTFAAARGAGGAVAGYMKFDNGWTPPYLGTLIDDSHIDGAFHSIDAGSCPLTLFHGLVP